MEAHIVPINWPNLVVIAGMLPKASNQTGSVLIADGLVQDRWIRHLALLAGRTGGADRHVHLNRDGGADRSRHRRRVAVFD